MMRRTGFLLLCFCMLGLWMPAQKKVKVTDFERVFEGSLNHEVALMMKLKAVKGKLRGEYYLQLKQEDILLEGEVDKKGNVYLEELDFKGKKLGIFKGKLSKDLVFTGRWYQMNGDQSIPVMLMASEREYAYFKENPGMNRTHIWWDKHRGKIGKGKEAWNPKPGEITSVEWKQHTFDFGTIKEGEVVEIEYEFKNTGDYPVKIMKVKPSCGCTTPAWSDEPVQPGETGYIRAAFDSKGKLGRQAKSVTVVMNTEPTHKILVLKGTVERAEEE